MSRDEEEIGTAEVKSSGKYFPRVSTQMLFQRWPRLYLVLTAEHCCVVVTQVVLVLEA